MLKIVGAWPRDYLNKTGNFTYLAIIVGFYLIPVSCFPLIHIYLNENTDVIKISQTAFVSGELALIAPKLIHLLIIHKKVKSVVGYWDMQDYYTVAPSNSNEIIAEALKEASQLTIWFTALAVSTATTWAIKPLQDLNNNKRLPADMWLPYDPFQNNFVYAITFLHFGIGKILVCVVQVFVFSKISLLLAAILCGIANAAIDTALGSLLLQGTAQMQILKEVLKNLGKNESEMDTEEGLKKCVLHYTAIVK